MVSHRPRVKETGRRDSNDRTRSNDGNRVRDNNVGYPPYELQPARRQNFFRESVLLEVTKRWEVNAYHLTRRGVKHGGGVTDKTRGDVRAKETESCQPTESPRDTKRPQLVDDRPRFQNVKDRPMFLPTSPEWFHLGSYDAPLVRDVRGLSIRQGKRGARREESPSGGGGEDLRNVIYRLGADKGSERYKAKSQTLGQSRTRESYEPYSRRTDPNEHRTRRHKYDADLPLNRKHKLVPYEQRGDDKTHERMLRWLSDDPTRFADAQRDVARWKEYLAEAVKNPVFPLFVSMTYGNRGLRP